MFLGFPGVDLSVLRTFFAYGRLFLRGDTIPVRRRKFFRVPAGVAVLASLNAAAPAPS